MLFSSIDALLRVSKTSSPQKPFDYDFVTILSFFDIFMVSTVQDNSLILDGRAMASIFKEETSVKQLRTLTAQALHRTIEHYIVCQESVKEKNNSPSLTYYSLINKTKNFISRNELYLPL